MSNQSPKKYVTKRQKSRQKINWPDLKDTAFKNKRICP